MEDAFFASPNIPRAKEKVNMTNPEKQIPFNALSRDYVLRVALYIRVSTEEQALFGGSLIAQEEALLEYAKENNMRVVKIYRDEGISGGKPIFKRPALSEMLEDVKAGKIDLILFTKLDRYFRNVREYFKAQEILDNNKCAWKAIHENYDTMTANGEMAVTNSSPKALCLPSISSHRNATTNMH